MIIKSWVDAPRYMHIETALRKYALNAGFKITINTDKRFFQETIFWEADGTEEQIRKFKNEMKNLKLDLTKEQGDIVPNIDALCLIKLLDGKIFQCDCGGNVFKKSSATETSCILCGTNYILRRHAKMLEED